jgi:hypothetical protein
MSKFTEIHPFKVATRRTVFRIHNNIPSAAKPDKLYGIVSAEGPAFCKYQFHFGTSVNPLRYKHGCRPDKVTVKLNIRICEGITIKIKKDGLLKVN